jgi:hypothetical protein
MAEEEGGKCRDEMISIDVREIERISLFQFALQIQGKERREKEKVTYYLITPIHSQQILFFLLGYAHDRRMQGLVAQRCAARLRAVVQLVRTHGFHKLGCFLHVSEKKKKKKKHCVEKK